MHPLGDRVRVCERQPAVNRDLQLNVDAVPKLPRPQEVDPRDAALPKNALPNGPLRIFVAAMVHHLVDRVSENVNGGFADEHADDDARKRVERGDAEPRAGNADERADGRERVGTVVPRVRHQRLGVREPRAAACVSEHRLLDRDGEHRREQRGKPRNRKRIFLRGQELSDALIPDEKSRDREDRRKNDRGDALHALVPVGVLPIGRFRGGLHADHHDDRAEHVRRRMDRVGDHRAGARENPRGKLDGGQERICNDGNP